MWAMRAPPSSSGTTGKCSASLQGRTSEGFGEISPRKNFLKKIEESGRFSVGTGKRRPSAPVKIMMRPEKSVPGLFKRKTEAQNVVKEESCASEWR